MKIGRVQLVDFRYTNMFLDILKMKKDLGRVRFKGSNQSFELERTSLRDNREE